MFKLIRQAFVGPPMPTADFTGHTIIVTGTNTGLGKEAVKHFVRCGAERVVATVRSSIKGKEALAEIEAETKHRDVVEVWELDYSDYTSVRAFCNKVSKLDRVDVVVLNAGIAMTTFEACEGGETQVVVNFISTTLLILLLLPILRTSGLKSKPVSRLTVVGSEVHAWASYPERDAPNSLDALNDPGTTTMHERYRTTKLLQLFAVREIAARTANKNPSVIINSLTPGLSITDLVRSIKGARATMIKLMYALVAFTAEQGSRALVHAAVAGPESHGILLEWGMTDTTTAAWITTEEGKRVQRKVWSELTAKLESIEPGVTRCLD